MFRQNCPFLPLPVILIGVLLLQLPFGVELCGYPGSPGHASVAFSSETIEAGTVATYTCDNGYELLGPPRRTCTENGTWIPQGIPFCVINVAVGKAAMQSSTVGNTKEEGAAQRAIDGSTSTVFNQNSCTLTEADRNNWWYVNLLEPYLVQLVRIDFGLPCCTNRPATVTVRVGNNRPDLGVNPICNKFTGFIEEGRPLFLPCARPMPGTFVSVHLESPGNQLSICETFVYTDRALSIEQCPSFRDQPLGSTSTYNGKCYIFYNNQPMTFDNGKRFCEIRGGSLVDETSPSLQGFLSWEIYRRHKNDPNTGQYWLGAVRDPRSPNNWKWINGKDVTISFWNQAGTGENCSRFDGSKAYLWSDTNCRQALNFVCQHRPLTCGKPERPANSTILARSVDIGSVIEYRCGPGNLLSGPHVRTCMTSGFFSEFPPKCKYLECGSPASISNGQYRLVNATRSYMSGVEYSCKEGYVLVGRAYLACDTDERWNGPPPRCEPILCPPPPPLEHGLLALSNNSTMFGTKTFYSCLPGFDLVGDSYITCNSLGYWEGQVPVCRLKVRPSTTTTTTTVTTTTTPPPTTQVPFIPPNLNVSPFRPPPHTIHTTLPNNYFPTNPTTTHRPSHPPQRFPPTVSINIPLSTTTTTTSTTKRPPVVSTKKTVNRHHAFDNEISDSTSAVRSGPGKSSRLNTGGIIALGFFGGFVFLAAVIVVVVIIFRRLKNSRSSIDAQTISTFDSTGDQSGFYRNYQQAWENLRYAGHSAGSTSPAYKASFGRVDDSTSYGRKKSNGVSTGNRQPNHFSHSSGNDHRLHGLNCVEGTTLSERHFMTRS